jgi:type I restriction enzyme M protein
MYRDFKEHSILQNPHEYFFGLFVLYFTSDDFRFHDAMVQDLLALPRHTQLLSYDLSYIDFKYILHNRSKYTADYINRVLKKIEQFYSNLEGVFNVHFQELWLWGNFESGSLDGILNLFEQYSNLMNQESDEHKQQEIKDFDNLLAYITRKEYIEVSTPHNLSKLLAELLETKEGDSIYDPACGVGSSLVSVAQTVNHNTCQFYGQERFEHLHRISKINMFVHNIKNVTLECGDTIKNPKFLTDNGELKTFDKIISILPFNANWSTEIASHDIFGRFEYGIPPKNCNDYAFILHMIKSLKPNGTMCIAVPSGVLFREKTEGNIRQRLIEENLIDTVITLPMIKVYKYNVSISILIIKKNRLDKNIFFIDASRWFKISSVGERTLSDEHVKKIINIYKNRDEQRMVSYKASFKEIKLNNFNLHIKKYIGSNKHQMNLDIESMSSNLVITQSKLETVQNKMEKFEKEFLQTLNISTLTR